MVSFIRAVPLTRPSGTKAMVQCEQETAHLRGLYMLGTRLTTFLRGVAIDIAWRHFRSQRRRRGRERDSAVEQPRGQADRLPKPQASWDEFRHTLTPAERRFLDRYLEPVDEGTPLSLAHALKLASRLWPLPFLPAREVQNSSYLIFNLGCGFAALVQAAENPAKAHGFGRKRALAALFAGIHSKCIVKCQEAKLGDIERISKQAKKTIAAPRGRSRRNTLHDSHPLHPV